MEQLYICGIPSQQMRRSLHIHSFHPSLFRGHASYDHTRDSKEHLPIMFGKQYFGLTGFSLNLAVGVIAGLDFLLFGYDQGLCHVV